MKFTALALMLIVTASLPSAQLADDDNFDFGGIGGVGSSGFGSGGFSFGSAGIGIGGGGIGSDVYNAGGGFGGYGGGNFGYGGGRDFRNYYGGYGLRSPFKIGFFYHKLLGAPSYFFRGFYH